MRTRLHLAVLAAACACATATPRREYASPAGDLGAYAEISLKNATQKLLAVSLWDDALTCSAPQVFVRGGVAAGEARVIYARMGEPLTVWAAVVHKPGDLCQVITTLVPTSASYAVTYDADPSDWKVCGATWAEGDEASNRPVPADRIVRREFKVSWGQDGPWCTALTDAQRAALGVAVPAAPAPATAPASTSN